MHAKHQASRNRASSASKVWRTSQLVAAAALAAGALFVTATPAGAATVTYDAVDLPDLVMGEDLWRYDYTVSGPLDAFWGLNLLFSPGNFAALDVLSVGAPSDLDAQPPVQPDAGLGTDGIVTLTALSALGGSFSTDVSVGFVWLGTGAPGAQAYEVTDDSFNVVGSSRTRPSSGPNPVSTSGTLSLALAGLLAAGLGRRARRG